VAFQASYRTGCRCSGLGGPSAGRLARSTKAEDKASPPGSRIEALPDSWPPLPSGEEPSASPCGKKTKATASPAIYSRGRGAHLPQEVGENQLKYCSARGSKGMVKTRAPPAAELLEDVVRTSQFASSEALPWQHPFVLYHFQEGVQGRCPRQALRQALLRTFIPARRCRAPCKALPFARKEGDKASPPCE
jgi:hypothetical protein